MVRAGDALPLDPQVAAHHGVAQARHGPHGRRPGLLERQQLRAVVRDRPLQPCQRAGRLRHRQHDVDPDAGPHPEPDQRLPHDPSRHGRGPDAEVRACGLYLGDRMLVGHGAPGARAQRGLQPRAPPHLRHLRGVTPAALRAGLFALSRDQPLQPRLCHRPRCLVALPVGRRLLHPAPRAPRVAAMALRVLECGGCGRRRLPLWNHLGRRNLGELIRFWFRSEREVGFASRANGYWSAPGPMWPSTSSSRSSLSR